MTVRSLFLLTIVTLAFACAAQPPKPESSAPLSAHDAAVSSKVVAESPKRGSYAGCVKDAAELCTDLTLRCDALPLIANPEVTKLRARARKPR